MRLRASIPWTLTIALAGCGVGGGLAASAGGGGGGGGAAAAKPTSTALYGPRPADDGKSVVYDVGKPADEKGAHPAASNLVTVRYSLRHLRARTVNVFPEYRLGALGEWKPMTIVPARGFGGTKNVDVPRARTPDASLLWNSTADLPRLSDENPTSRFIAQVRVRFEDASGATETDSRFPPAEFVIDENLAGPVASDTSSSLPSGTPVPTGLKLDATGLLIACAKADVVDHLSFDPNQSKVERRIGRGEFLPSQGFIEPGVDVGNADAQAANDALRSLVTDAGGEQSPTQSVHGDPAAVQPRALLGLTSNDDGTTIYTANHYFLEAATIDQGDVVGSIAVIPRTKTTFTEVDPTPLDPSPHVKINVKQGPACFRRPALDAGGALLYADTAFATFPFTNIVDRILAVNPQDPADPASSSVTFAGASLAPGAAPLEVYRSGNAEAIRIHELVVGPQGEVYFDARGAGNLDFVFAYNPTNAVIHVGKVPVPAKQRAAVAGPFRIVGTGEPPDARDVASWDDIEDKGHDEHEPLCLAVAKTARVLFVAVPQIGDQGVYAFDLDPNRGAAVSFAGVEIPQVAPPATAADAKPDAKSGRVVFDSKDPVKGEPGRTFQFGAAPVNAIEVDAKGERLFLAHTDNVFFVNGGASDVADFGRASSPTAPGASAKIYDAAKRSGVPISHPRGVAARDDGLLFFADDRMIRALNLGATSVKAGNVTVAPGEFAVVAGATLTGFNGDGGPAAAARFFAPSALAVSRQNELYVADTQNHRVRLIHVGDPLAADAILKFGATIAPGHVATVAGGDKAPTAPFGDGGAPTNATLSAPEGVALRQRDGVVFVADTGHHAIRAMNPGAVTVKIAGTDVAPGAIQTIAGIPADVGGPLVDGPAIGSVLDAPTGLAVDQDHDLLFFADRANHRVAVLNLANPGEADGAPTIAGVNLPAPAMIRVICGTDVASSSGDGGPASQASVVSPQGLALARDAAGGLLALYFADSAPGVVRVVNLSGRALTLSTDGDGRFDFGAASAVPSGFITTVNPNPASPASPLAGLDDADAASLELAGTPTRSLAMTAPIGIAIVEKLDLDSTPARGPIGVFVADQGGERLVRLPFAGFAK